MNKDCIFYTEIQDMHAAISQCRRSTKFADCPCGSDCEHYIPIELARSMDIKPIVRCKDCKHFSEAACKGIGWCKWVRDTRNSEWFCAAGERRE